jgi:hypothetical protein
MAELGRTACLCILSVATCKRAQPSAGKLFEPAFEFCDQLDRQSDRMTLRQDC